MKTNREIASEVLAEWLEPQYPTFIQMGLLSSSAAVTSINEKLRRTGWVAEDYTILTDLQPHMGASVQAVLKAAILDLMVDVPDEAIPELAHTIIHSATEKGQLSLLGGKLVFDADDLQRLGTIMGDHVQLES